MNDLERDVRGALERMLDPIEPERSLLRHAVRRAKIRRALSAIVVGSTALLLIGAATWGAVAIRDGSTENSPKVVGDPSTRDADPRLYLAGDGELWRADLDGDVKHIQLSELAPGDAPYRIVRRGDRLVAWGYETYLLDPELESPPQVLVKDSLIFIPSADPDRIWVGIDDRDDEQGALEAVREVTADGVVTVPDVRPPGGKWPERSVEDGLVFSSQREKFVWDPETDEVVFRFEADSLGPTHGNLIAWCDGNCETVHITDVSSGVDKTVEPPQGFAAFDVWGGVYSPDGRTLAVPVRSGIARLESSNELQLALVDVGTTSARAVQGSEVPGPYNFIDWSPSSDYVFITGSEGSDRTIVAYRMGDDRARTLPVEVGSFFGVAAN